jgi:hypothetical protein
MYKAITELSEGTENILETIPQELAVQIAKVTIDVNDNLPVSIETAIYLLREEWSKAELYRAWQTGDPATVADTYQKVRSSFQEEQDPYKNTGFRLIPIHQLECKPPEWIVRDYLEADSLAVAFGDPASGKSFWAICLGCCIAIGADFYSLPVISGPVIFIAGEGRNGIARRLKAWEIRNGLDLSKAPFYLSKGPAALCDPESTAQVLNAVDQVARDAPPKLVVIDTLARNFGPGDENSAKDMTAAIQAMDTIRTRYRCTVLMIHHTGHGDKTRERGSMALRGGLDASYRLDRDESDVVRLTPLKMKEAELPDPMAFKIRTVELGFQDEDGREVTSAVLDPVDYEPPPKPTKAGRGKWQQVALVQLKHLEHGHRERLERGGFDPDQARVTVESWRDACLGQGMSRQTWNNARHSLSEQSLIVLDDKYVKSQ